MAIDINEELSLYTLYERTVENSNRVICLKDTNNKKLKGEVILEGSNVGITLNPTNNKLTLSTVLTTINDLQGAITLKSSSNMLTVSTDSSNRTITLGLDITAALDGKVDKVSGKGLSTNDYTTDDKNKLNGIAPGAEVNVKSDWDVTDMASNAFIKNKPTFAFAPQITSEDFNELTTSGLYAALDCFNHPPGIGASALCGLIVVKHSVSGYVQLLFEEPLLTNGNLYIRRKDSNITSSWTKWIKVNAAENITTASINASSGSHSLILNESNVQDILQRLAEKICALETQNGMLSTSLPTHTTNETTSGSKYIPSSGSWNNTLKYDSSGTAEWTPSPFTYRNTTLDLTANTWYKLALCNFSLGDEHGGGSAIITVTAYKKDTNIDKRQTVMCRAIYSGGTASFQLLGSVCKDENSKVFDEVSCAKVDNGFIAFKAYVDIPSITINITVQSSISENRVDFKANDNEWDDATDGNWITSHTGSQIYYEDTAL